MTRQDDDPRTQAVRGALGRLQPKARDSDDRAYRDGVMFQAGRAAERAGAARFQLFAWRGAAVAATAAAIVLAIGPRLHDRDVPAVASNESRTVAPFNLPESRPVPAPRADAPLVPPPELADAFVSGPGAPPLVAGSALLWMGRHRPAEQQGSASSVERSPRSRAPIPIAGELLFRGADAVVRSNTNNE